MLAADASEFNQALSLVDSACCWLFIQAMSRDKLFVTAYYQWNVCTNLVLSPYVWSNIFPHHLCFIDDENNTSNFAVLIKYVCVC